MQQAIIRERVFVQDVGNLGANAQSGSTVGYTGSFAVMDAEPLPLYMCLGNPTDAMPTFPTVSLGEGKTVSTDVGSVSAYAWSDIDNRGRSYGGISFRMPISFQVHVSGFRVTMMFRTRYQSEV